MKRSKKFLTILMVVTLAVVCVCIHGCKKSGGRSGKAGTAIADSIELCTHCGQIKGGDLCCKPDQLKCPACGLVKGSPGCCKIPKDAQTAAICTMCGQIKGSDLCCKPNQVRCAKCGLVQGSPGCCKLPAM